VGERQIAELNETQCHGQSLKPYSIYVTSTIYLHKIHPP